MPKTQKSVKRNHSTFFIYPHKNSIREAVNMTALAMIGKHTLHTFDAQVIVCFNYPESVLIVFEPVCVSCSPRPDQRRLSRVFLRSPQYRDSQQ